MPQFRHFELNRSGLGLQIPFIMTGAGTGSLCVTLVSSGLAQGIRFGLK
jgi:small-conductance mechanosensitive channel